MKHLIYLMDHILYQTFKNLLNISLKKHGEKTTNASIKIYVNKIEHRIRFRIKTGYYIEFLTPETMKLLGSIATLLAYIINKVRGSCIKIQLLIKE